MSKPSEAYNDRLTSLLHHFVAELLKDRTVREVSDLIDLAVEHTEDLGKLKDSYPHQSQLDCSGVLIEPMLDLLGGVDEE